MSNEEITIEVDGVALPARKGQMLIEVTDAAGNYIPRFCYHKKLSVAANCRMCLVEVERAPKALPACATPVADGMKVLTRSPKAIAAQKATMEFLLINHPLDCPICDQGGECELQDLALGYGGDVSQYTERKRIVQDENLGPLISTDMTRCIHCTRCVRYGEEVLGLRELGATGRGEFMRIGTYVGRTVTSEMSGNVIDLCPVGALTARPSRYTARPWELEQAATVSPHDCFGTNLNAHVRRGQLMRVVPRENEGVNETWVSDRDRFSYPAIYSESRLRAPMINVDGVWEETDWETALETAIQGLKRVDASDLGILASPNATVEELFLLKRIADGLGCANVDHRQSQAEFGDQTQMPVFPWLGMDIADLERLSGALVIGSNVRKEVPLAHHRLRKAAMAGGQICAINPKDFDFRFDLPAHVVTSDMGESLAAVALAVSELTGESIPKALESVVQGVSPDQTHITVANILRDGERAAVLLGQIAADAPGAGVLRALAAYVAAATNSRLGYLPAGGNAAGAWLCGIVPHRQLGGSPSQQAGKHAGEMLTDGMRGYLLLGVEPELEARNGRQAEAVLNDADFVVALTPFVSKAMRDYAHVILPIGTFAETAGTFINAEGRWQSFNGCAAPVGESRPAWKLLRVMGNLLGLDGFDYVSAKQVADSAREAVGAVMPNNHYELTGGIERPLRPTLQRLGEVPLCASDGLVRRSKPLQETPDADAAKKAYLNASEAERLGLTDADQVVVSQGDGRVTLPLVIDNGLADGWICIAAGIPETRMLGERFGSVEVQST
ncbi:MAG: NADH-quinone oxidoreductase subunit NuoG [Pseudomonadota bacterium]|nr:NADH-quinone oxidoreductase subunit NuoG [Pseudomonadota bacterium]